MGFRVLGFRGSGFSLLFCTVSRYRVASKHLVVFLCDVLPRKAVKALGRASTMIPGVVRGGDAKEEQPYLVRITIAKMGSATSRDDPKTQQNT